MACTQPHNRTNPWPAPGPLRPSNPFLGTHLAPSAQHPVAHAQCPCAWRPVQFHPHTRAAMACVIPKHRRHGYAHAHTLTHNPPPRLQAAPWMDSLESCATSPWSSTARRSAWDMASASSASARCAVPAGVPPQKPQHWGAGQHVPGRGAGKRMHRCFRRAPQCHEGWYGLDCARKRAGLEMEPGERLSVTTP